MYKILLLIATLLTTAAISPETSYARSSYSHRQHCHGCPSGFQRPPADDPIMYLYQDGSDTVEVEIKARIPDEAVTGVGSRDVFIDSKGVMRLVLIDREMPGDLDKVYHQAYAVLRDNGDPIAVGGIIGMSAESYSNLRYELQRTNCKRTLIVETSSGRIRAVRMDGCNVR